MTMKDNSVRKPIWQAVYQALVAVEPGVVIGDAELRALIPGATAASVKEATYRAIRYAARDGYSFSRIRRVGYMSARTKRTAFHPDELLAERFGSIAQIEREGRLLTTHPQPPDDWATVERRRRILLEALPDHDLYQETAA